MSFIFSSTNTQASQENFQEASLKKTMPRHWFPLKLRRLQDRSSNIYCETQEMKEQI